VVFALSSAWIMTHERMTVLNYHLACTTSQAHADMDNGA
jgi:hypothetical protein